MKLVLGVFWGVLKKNTDFFGVQTWIRVTEVQHLLVEKIGIQTMDDQTEPVGEPRQLGSWSVEPLIQ